MNCLEFRQLVLVDPYDPELEVHAESCQQCTKFRADVLDMDSDIEKALAVEVPEGLAARVLLNQSLSDKKKPVTVWVRYSMAASFAAALIFGAYLFTQESEPVSPELAVTTQSVNAPMIKDEPQAKAEGMDMIKKHMAPAPGTNPYLAHAMHQPHEFYGSEHKPIDDESLERLMNRFELTASIDHVVYAAICPLDGEDAAHLVIKDGTDQYTVMLLPDRSPGKMYTVDDDTWRGYVSPHPAGALAVLAEADDPDAVNRIREVADKMQSAIYLTAGF